MSKKTHQRELDRARAKRQAEAYARRQQRVRVIAIAVIIALGGAVFVSALASSSDDDATTAADQFDDGQADDTTNDQADDTTPEASDAPVAVVADACENPSEGAPDSPRKTYDAAPEMVIDTAKSYTATIVTTCGTIVVELAAAEAPNTVNNFVFLARDGYYDGAPFHRVIDDFMIQGGDPSGTGSGEGGTFPGYTFDDELDLAQQVSNANGGYPRGTLAMANAGPNTNGSQFFIMQVHTRAAYPLPPNYAVFGTAISGMDVVDRIAQGPAAGDQAIEPVRIISIEITEA